MIETSHTTRRALIKAAPAVCVAAAALPAVVAVAAEGDTAIQRLWAECEALRPELDRLERAQEEAYDRFYEMKPPVPEEMHMSEFDAHWTGVREWFRIGHGEDRNVTWVTTEGWRHSVTRPLVPAETGPNASVMGVTKHRARAREVLPVAERYEADVEAMRVASGYRAADDALEQASNRLYDLGNTILDAEPETLADVLVQIKVCEERGYDDDEFPGYAAMALIRSIKHIAQLPATA